MATTTPLEIVEKTLNDEATKTRLNILSQFIHQNPELAMKEEKACEALCKELEFHGFSVVRNFVDIPTAFRAQYVRGSSGPTICAISEYDALPNGHSCGHNLIAISGIGAALAVKALMDHPDTGLFLIFFIFISFHFISFH